MKSAPVTHIERHKLSYRSHVISCNTLPSNLSSLFRRIQIMQTVNAFADSTSIDMNEHETPTVSIPRPTPEQNSDPNLYRETDETTSVNYIIIIIRVPLLLENDGLGLLSAHGL